MVIQGASQVLGRLSTKPLQTMWTAEVVRRPVVLVSMDGDSEVHVHAADGILHDPPASAMMDVALAHGIGRVFFVVHLALKRRTGTGMWPRRSLRTRPVKRLLH